MSRIELCAIALSCLMLIGLVLASIASHAEEPSGDAARIE